MITQDTNCSPADSADSPSSCRNSFWSVCESSPVCWPVSGHNLLVEGLAHVTHHVTLYVTRHVTCHMTHHVTRHVTHVNHHVTHHMTHYII